MSNGRLNPQYNRVRTSVALKGNNMWEKTIGIGNEHIGTNSAIEASLRAPSRGIGREARREMAQKMLEVSGVASSNLTYEGILSLARSQGGLGGGATRGACRICGGLGHLTKQCMNGVSGHSGGIDDLDAAAAAEAAKARNFIGDSDLLDLSESNGSSSSSSSGSDDSCSSCRRSFSSSSDGSTSEDSERSRKEKKKRKRRHRSQHASDQSKKEGEKEDENKKRRKERKEEKRRKKRKRDGSRDRGRDRERERRLSDDRWKERSEEGQKKVGEKGRGEKGEGTNGKREKEEKWIRWNETITDHMTGEEPMKGITVEGAKRNAIEVAVAVEAEVEALIVEGDGCHEFKAY
eukprot:CAMPEP_0175056656 /NCGR_PEP_ID=MMETSP0052_2-20121109/10803_1 /TAXON_ID=51329 ORGANISM="Polytomella parva, Strain SAG 63-3" /NCGR_SAMPLE_ID=MMETSP0052_2 /ASSEMBLY_ACC=CAM_ASM_000194 /LENGTH=348 /DNA_ID=CAMNT_0016321729 /DNA_START=150 /DNA_END=1197 /DNA_ORIENTATION=-